MLSVDPLLAMPAGGTASRVLLAAATGETVGVVASVVAAAIVGALVGTVVARRRRPPVDAGLADARIAALWAGTRAEPAPVAEPAEDGTAASPTALALTVWRLAPDQVLGLVLDALGDLGLELVEVTGDRAVLTGSPGSSTGPEGGPATAVATSTPAVAIDGTGEGLHVHIGLTGAGAPALADALRRRLVVAAPSDGPVALLQDPAIRARAGDARR